jgi:hypothetical protein
VIKPQQFIGLAAAAAVSVVLALGVYIGNNNWSKGTVEGAPFVPDLEARINSVGAVEITQGGKTLTVTRDGGTWKIKERDGFPAKPEVARALLVALAQAKLVEPRTAVSEKLALLELEDPASQGAKSRHVRVLDDKGSVISDVILGKARADTFGSGKGGIYVRRAGETQSWLATGDPKVTSDLRDWVDTSAYTGDTARIIRVTIENPGEEPLVIERTPAEEKTADATKGGETPAKPAPAKGKYQLAAMPEGKKLKDGAKIDDIVEAFSSISFEDVRKLATPPAGDTVQTIKVEYDKGPVVTFHLRADGDTRWLSLAAVGEGDARKAADDINAKDKGWAFQVPKWKADQIGKRRADLLEPTS